MELHYTARFIRSFKKLPKAVQEDAHAALEQFQSMHARSTLKLHKLSGSMKGYRAFSINFRYRIVVKQVKDGTVYCMDVGTHDVYR